MKPKVLITGRIPSTWLGELASLAEVDVWSGVDSFLMPDERIRKTVGKYSGIINFAEIKTDADFVDQAKRLEIIANASIGYDNLDLPLLGRKGIWASNAPGFFHYPVAEYILAGILTILRRMLEADTFVRRGEWCTFEPGRWDGNSLKDKVLGIVGLGSIGNDLMTMARSFGTEVIYHTPRPRDIEGWVTFEELIRRSDIVSINVPLNASTYGLFNGKVIGKMRPGAILVNTSRGKVVDLSALIEALEKQQIAGAVLDVFEDEPHVPAGLLQKRNVLLTPHMAGGTLQAREACLKRAIQNVVCVLKGQQPVDPLNKPAFQ